MDGMLCRHWVVSCKLNEHKFMSLLCVSGWHEGTKTPQTTRETSHAIYALQSKSLGSGESTEPRVETLGNWEDNWTDVAWLARRR